MPPIFPRRTLGALCCAALLATLIPAAGCLQAPTRTARLTEAAREMNLATRFGRLDLAAEHTAAGARPHFLKRRADWGHDIRVVDVELTGMEMKDDENAVVQVDVAWTRMDEGHLRTTRVGQQWQDREGSWLLVRERRVSGDFGLFGEPVEEVQTAPRGDVHFPSKTIR
ncbi:MAG: hypothetical protein KIT72_16525 [Polyangiaceae bacterium]|nr:hypothetical protein [Polyangiaceae bacterium]MCW5792023.1 hypothetical protein [Polyangiaceae bacterium]